MKKFKEFRTEQKYIAEIGPIAATIGAVVGGIALYKGGKSLWKGIKGWNANRKEKKANPAGTKITVAVFNKETGKIEKVKKKLPKKFPTHGTTGSTNKEVKDWIKKYKDKADDDKEIWDSKNEPETDDTPTSNTAVTSTPSGTPPDDELERDEEGNLKNKKDAEAYFKDKGEAPSGWRNAGDADKPDLMTTKEYKKKKDQKVTKALGGDVKPEPKKNTPAGLESKVLKFGEFIAEDIMSDLKKVTKSKKDNEISLDDGNDIPIDPLTAEILVKYIGGLGSSEKNKTIKQIQRTERAFMKDLGKAHGA